MSGRFDAIVEFRFFPVNSFIASASREKSWIKMLSLFGFTVVVYFIQLLARASWELKQLRESKLNILFYTKVA